MYLRKRPQLLFALSCQFYQNTPAVIFISYPFQQSEPCHAIHQLDGCVVSNEKEFCEIADRNPLRAGKALDGEKCLMLLRCKSRFMSRGLAERQKFPKLESKLSERFVIDGMRGATFRRFFARLGRRFVQLLPFRSQHPPLRLHDNEGRLYHR
jgi:hypothetical protein